MPLFDMPLEVMRQYRPAREEPDDFDQFWADTLAQTRSQELSPVFEPADFGLTTFDVYDVTFSGYNGDRIKGWYMRPRGAAGLCPASCSSSAIRADAVIPTNGCLSLRPV